MLRQIKFLLCILILSTGIVVHAQDSVFFEAIETADSIHEMQISRLRSDLERLSAEFRRYTQEYEITIDSLMLILDARKAEIGDLHRANDEAREEIARVAAMVVSTRAALEENRRSARQMLLIAVPSLLIIILIASLLFFSQLSRYQKRTETSIRTLRKYTCEGIEEMRTGYAEEIRKKVKKMFTKFVKQEKKERRKELKKIKKKGK